MKKILLIFLVLFLLAAAGTVVFALTFDLDRYRPLILDKIEQNTGLTADLDRISLGWSGGAALQIRQLTLYRDKEKQKELFKFDTLSVLVHLMPLLNRRLEISSIVLEEPDIRLVRGPDGRLRGLENLEAQKAEKPGGGSAVAGALLLSTVSRAEIKDGRFSFRDEAGGYVTETVLNHIDLTVKDISLMASVPFRAEAAFASPRQNITLSGKFRIQPLEIEAAELETDLGQAQIEDLLKMFPAMRNSGLMKINGRLTASVQGVQPGKAEIWQKGEVRLSGGRIQLEGMPSIENLQGEAALAQNRADIRKISGSLGEGNFSLTGKAEQLNTQPLIAVQGTVAKLDLGQIIPPAGPGQPSFRGIAGLNFEGTAAGKSAADFSRTAAGSGQLALENGVIQNLNVLREIFSKLSMIPGLVQRLQQRLPANYQEKLQARDTYLAPVQLPFTVNQGTLFFDNLNVSADSFALTSGKGSISSQFIRIQALLMIDPELSLALIRSVQELSSLADQEGRLVVPVNIQGPPEQVSAFPDVQYVASKVAMTKLSEFLAPKKQPQTGTGYADPNQSSMAGQDPQAPASGLDSLRKMKGKDLLAQFLGSSLGQSSQDQQQ